MSKLSFSLWTDPLCIWAFVAQDQLDRLLAELSGRLIIDSHVVPVFGSARTLAAAKYSSRPRKRSASLARASNDIWTMAVHSPCSGKTTRRRNGSSFKDPRPTCSITVGPCSTATSPTASCTRPWRNSCAGSALKARPVERGFVSRTPLVGNSRLAGAGSARVPRAVRMICAL